MNQGEIKQLFDQQATSYDQQWAKMSPIREGLHFLIESVFSQLPEDARILSVGVGTGAELAHLAEKFPGWKFTAVEPSSQMLGMCRERAENEGFASRCKFHEGYIDSLPTDEMHHAATCFLVSQFILDQKSRTEFFREIATRLEPGGVLASSDLTSDVGSQEYEALLEVWMNVMSTVGIPPEGRERMRTVYANDVAILPPDKVASIIKSAGFESSVQFYQAGLIHAWFSHIPSA